jgi:hypothetical protein
LKGNTVIKIFKLKGEEEFENLCFEYGLELEDVVRFLNNKDI